jgi:multidrug efflux pump subunit AcrA (membrane-fusion protein)
MSVRWWVAGGGVILLAIWGAVSLGNLGRQSATVRVVVTPVKPAGPPTPTEVTLTGIIQATKIIKVAAPVDGTIEQFVADIGDDVAKGDVLARIRNPKVATEQDAARLNGNQARNRVQELEAAVIGARLEASRSDADATRTQMEIGRAQKEFERQQTMMQEGVTPRLVFEKAQKDFETLKTQAADLTASQKRAQERAASLARELDLARKAAEKSARRMEGTPEGVEAGEVTSPADGVVMARRGKEGEAVSKTKSELFQIAVGLEKLELVLTPDAPTAARLRPGQTVTVEIKEYPSMAQGTIREVKSGQALIDFLSPAPSVRPGMTAQIKLKF